MTDMADGHIRVGKILSQGFGVLLRNLGRFGPLALLVMSPSLIFGLWTGLADPEALAATLTGTESLGFWAGFAVIGLATGLLYLFLQAAIISGTYDDLCSNQPSMGRSFRVGLSRVLPVLLVTIVGMFLIGLASIALIIPGIILFVMFYVMIPVAVVERPGIIASLKRSRELTRGNRWRVFGLILILFVITVVFQFGTGFVYGFLPLGENLVAFLILGWVQQAVSVLLSVTFVAVTYFALREAKEGLDVNELAAVFE